MQVMHQKYLKKLLKYNLEKYNGVVVMSKKSDTKKKLSKKGLIIGLVIITILIIILIVVLVIRSRSLDPESKLVTEIYSYLGNNDLEVCSGLATYADDTVTYDDLENAMRICTAYSLLELDDSAMLKVDKTQKNNTCTVGESDNITFATDNYEDDICTLTKVSSEEVNTQYEKMYGKSIENYETFQYNETTICQYDAGYYYCGLAEEYTATFGGEPHTYRTIRNVTESDDEIIIYDYFIKVVNNECYTSYTGSTLIDECSDNYNEDEEMTYSFIKKYGTLYKHTYQKSGDNYYWVSSTPSK